MTDGRPQGEAVASIALRLPPIWTHQTATVAVLTLAGGALASLTTAPPGRLADPRFQIALTVYLIVVAAVVVGVVALWRARVRRQGGVPPIRFAADHLELPLSAVSLKTTRIPYADIRSLQITGGAQPSRQRLILDTSRRSFTYPLTAFVESGAVPAIARRLREKLAKLPDAVTLLALMDQRQAIAEQFARFRPLGTWAVLAIIVAVYALQFFLQGDRRDPFAAIELGANAATLVADGQWFRLATANLLHSGMLHLAVNAVSVLAVGAIVERQLGTARFLVVVLATGLISQGASALAAEWRATTLYSVGVSGALFGVLGALAVLNRRFGKQLPGGYRLPPRAWWTLLINFTVLPLAIPQLDIAAHVGGLLSGAAVGWLLCRRLEIAGRSAPGPAGWAALAGLGAAWLAAIAVAVPHATDEKRRSADRALLVRSVAVRTTSSSAIDNAFAWMIATDPAADASALSTASLLAERALSREPAGLRAQAITDTLATVRYRQGEVAAAIDLEEKLLQQPNETFASQLARFLDRHYQAHGTRLLGDPPVPARTVTVRVIPPADVVIEISEGEPLPQGAILYALVRRENRLMGLLQFKMLPRGAEGARLLRHNTELPPLGAAIAGGAEISIAQFDSSGCGCTANSALYFLYAAEVAKLP